MIQADAINRLQQTFGLRRDEPLKGYTSFRVGGPADLLALPKTRQKLLDLIRAAGEAAIPVTVIGGGSNLLISDNGIRGLVIVLKELRSGIQWKKTSDTQVRIFMDAGERLATVCRFSADAGLSGLEFCAGIPGTIGGAVVMNAGDARTGVCDRVHSLEVLNRNTLGTETLAGEDLVYTYRHLDLPDRIILSLALTLTPRSPAVVKKRFEEKLNRKIATQPVQKQSAGCFFKNPGPDMPAGKLIEDAGLKGLSVNDARVSEQHANYIINTGNATCKDILALKTRIQETVFETYGIQLETEVKVTGDE